MTPLNKKIEQLIYEKATDFEIATVIKGDIGKYYATLPEIFQQTSGRDFLYNHTHSIDNIIKLVYKITLRSMFGNYMPMKNSLPITVVALGSYGREQLCVHSDIDLMIVYEDTAGYQIKEMIEKMLYLFWDIGLKLGHRVHEISELPEVASGDITIKSAILESRFIDGSKSLWTGIENKITLICRDQPVKFIREKLEEQRKFHRKFPLTMEPNLKEGVGGFRDANLVFWFGKLLHNAPRIKDIPSDIIDESDYRRFRISLEFIFRVRSVLHLISGKKEDRLHLETIPEAAMILGFGDTKHAQMRFAKKTTESLRVINLYGKIWLEALISHLVPDMYDGFLVLSSNDNKLSSMIEKLNQNANTSFQVHPQTLKKIIHSRKPERIDNKLYKVISNIFHHKSAYSVLNTLHEARLLRYTIPPMKKVVNLPQFDGYHQYSVDMHSLKCLDYLENIEDELLLDIYSKLGKKEKHLLKITTFLHDAGKGRHKAHALVGVSLFRIFASKIKLDAELVTLGEKLIRYHDLMSVTAQREDLYSEKTILQFASIFNSQKLLDMIYLLTYADMNGVGSGIYSNFTAKLLKTLYKESVSALKHDKILSTTARKFKKIERLKRDSDFRALPGILQKKILSVPSNEFFIYNSPNKIISVSKMAFETKDFQFKITNQSFLTIEILKVSEFNLGYFLSKLSRLNIVNLEVVKLFDKLKYFKIDFNEVIDNSEIPLVEDILQRSFNTTLKPDLIKPKIKKSEIEIDCEHSRDYGVIRLRTKDQKGLLAFIIHLLDKLEIDIVSTKIHTSKYRVNDLFLIEKNGNFCNNIDNITKQLTE